MWGSAYLFVFSNTSKVDVEYGTAYLGCKTTFCSIGNIKANQSVVMMTGFYNYGVNSMLIASSNLKLVSGYSLVVYDKLTFEGTPSTLWRSP